MQRRISENGGSVLQKHLARLGLSIPLDELVQRHSPVDYAKGSAVFLPNSAADLLFWIEAGLVKVCAPAADGSRFVVHLAGPGEIVGYTSTNDFSGEKVQSFEAEAFTRCSVVPVTREHVRYVLNTQSPAAMLGVLEAVNTAWAEVFSEFVSFLSLTFRDRLQNVLNDLGARFGVPDARGTLLTPELSHDDFAELIGSSRPMATRLISELIDEGVIARDGKRYILRNSSKTGATPRKTSPRAAEPG